MAEEGDSRAQVRWRLGKRRKEGERGGEASARVGVEATEASFEIGWRMSGGAEVCVLDVFLSKVNKKRK